MLSPTAELNQCAKTRSNYKFTDTLGTYVYRGGLLRMQYG
jgi:hypothetical protein